MKCLMRWTITALALLCRERLASQSPYAGLTSVSESQSGAQGEQRDVVEIMGTAIALRSVGSTDSWAIPERFAFDPPGRTSGMRTLFQESLGAALPGFWSCFFRASTIHGGHLRSSRPRLVYYHPFADSALVMDWMRTATGWRVVDVVVLPGEVLRNEGLAPDAPAAWRAISGRSLAGGLHEVFQRTSQALVRSLPVLSREPAMVMSLTDPARIAHQELVEARVLAILDEVLVFGEKDPAAALLAEQVRSALVSGVSSGLGALLPSSWESVIPDLLAVPAEIRSDLVLRDAVSWPGGFTFFLGSAHSGRWVYTGVANSGRDGARPELVTLAFIDLDCPTLTP